MLSHFSNRFISLSSFIKELNKYFNRRQLDYNNRNEINWNRYFCFSFNNSHVAHRDPSVAKNNIENNYGLTVSIQKCSYTSKLLETYTTEAKRDGVDDIYCHLRRKLAPLQRNRGSKLNFLSGHREVRKTSKPLGRTQ